MNVFQATDQWVSWESIEDEVMEIHIIKGIGREGTKLKKKPTK